MLTQPFRPEGLHTLPPDPAALAAGADSGEIFTAMCIKCDELHNLHLDLGSLRGMIPRDETALGVREGRVRPIGILSRVGKPVSFQVLGSRSDGTLICSRRAAQADAKSYFFSALRPGDILPVGVQSVTDTGVFCDMGCGFTARIRIDRCCVSRLQSARDQFYPGQALRAAILAIRDDVGQIDLTHRELLGTWEENAADFAPGQTVPGIARSVMPYGIFVELTPNFSGLAEPTPGIQAGDPVSVYIRGILPQKHKCKLNILEKLSCSTLPRDPVYYIRSGHMDRWEYYPGSSAVTYF